MSKSLRFGSALSAIALASVIAGCATPGGRSATSLGSKDGKADIGLAMRALVALNDNDYATALNFAERAVEKSPNDAGFRALLGNVYFGSGRFASAQAAYRDSLSLVGNQPQVVLKLALVEIAQGRNGEALALLGEARGMLEPADYGLAMALAGQPQEAVGLLEAAARRQPGADARLRQNLALAYALSGEWDAARTVAAQDVSADLLDARIQEWMAFAKPRAASDQVAALTGVRPVASDPGQPTRLALRGSPTRNAQAAPAVNQPQQVAAYAPPPVAEQAYASQFDQLASAPASELALAPVMEAAAPAFVETAPVIEPVYVESKRAGARPAALSASFTAKLKPARPASFARRNGNSTAVVQIGAYGSAQRVAAAWNTASKRYSVLRDYTPMSARFDSPKGVVHRLSVKGFASLGEAKNLCASVRRAGGSCFVRSVAGDVPVRLASR